MEHRLGDFDDKSDFGKFILEKIKLFENDATALFLNGNNFQKVFSTITNFSGREGLKV